MPDRHAMTGEQMDELGEPARGPTAYVPARCAECRAPATRPGGDRGRGPYSIKLADHDPGCATGQRDLLAAVHVTRDGRVLRPAYSGAARDPLDGRRRLVGYVDRYKGNRTIAQRKGGPWRWVLDGGEASPVCYPTRRAALLSMLRNPRAR